VSPSSSLSSSLANPSRSGDTVKSGV
jgi:hypothetical protein